MQLEYVPGACNIGPEEIARRQRVARIGLVATVALALLLLASGVGVGSPTRLLVGLPLTGAAIGWIQARRRFCMAYGLAGTFNLGAIGNMERVSSAAALAADRAGRAELRRDLRRRLVASALMDAAGYSALIG